MCLLLVNQNDMVIINLHMCVSSHFIPHNLLVRTGTSGEKFGKFGKINVKDKVNYGEGYTCGLLHDTCKHQLTTIHS